MDGWTDGLTTPQQLRTELLDPRVRCVSAHFERSTYHSIFHFFLPGSRTGSPSSPFSQSASFPACVSPGSSCFFKHLFRIFGGPAARSFCLFSNTPSCTHSALVVDARLAREPGLWHFYRARLKHERVDISRRAACVDVFWSWKRRCGIGV